MNVSENGRAQAATRRAISKRWLIVWMVLGAGLALLLLVDSIATYHFVSRAIVVDRARRELTRTASEVEHRMQVQHAASEAEVKELLTAISEEHEHLMWLDLRWPDGNITVRTKDHPTVSFAGMDVASRLRDHMEVVTTAPTSSGEAVVGIFMIHALAGRQPPMAPLAMGAMPHSTSTPPSGAAMPIEAQSKVDGPPGHRGHSPFPILEVAMSMSAVDAEFWPIRRNLIIDCTAAIALLLSTFLAALRFRSYLRAQELEHQLRIARQVQQSLLLSGSSTSQHVQVAAECIPAWHVGGDFYDSFRAHGEAFALVLGDVSGKGVPAALLAGLIHGAVRSSEWTASAEQHEQACRKLNELLLERASGERYATMFWSYYDPTGRRLHYINAGHCPPLLLRRNGNGVEVKRLEEGGTVVGLLPFARYRQSSEAIEPEDLLVVFSDGIAEANNSKEEEFGEERLLQVLRANYLSPVSELREKVLAAVREFAAGTPAADDLTLVIARFEGTPEAGRQPAEAELAAI